MFRSSAKLLRFRPENGLHVTVRGRITVYEDRGELQISAEFMEPKGAGALQLAFEQLKARLQAEGLFEASRKKPIPPLPQRIGIITSPQGAALRDILNILARRHHSANVLIYPAQVQGDAAAGRGDGRTASTFIRTAREVRLRSSSSRAAEVRPKTWPASIMRDWRARSRTRRFP